MEHRTGVDRDDENERNRRMEIGSRCSVRAWVQVSRCRATPPLPSVFSWDGEKRTAEPESTVAEPHGIRSTSPVVIQHSSDAEKEKEEEHAKLGLARKRNEVKRWEGAHSESGPGSRWEVLVAPASSICGPGSGPGTQRGNKVRSWYLAAVLPSVGVPVRVQLALKCRDGGWDRCSVGTSLAASCRTCAAARKMEKKASTACVCVFHVGAAETPTRVIASVGLGRSVTDKRVMSQRCVRC